MTTMVARNATLVADLEDQAAKLEASDAAKAKDEVAELLKIKLLKACHKGQIEQVESSHRAEIERVKSAHDTECSAELSSLHDTIARLREDARNGAEHLRDAQTTVGKLRLEVQELEERLQSLEGSRRAQASACAANLAATEAKLALVQQKDVEKELDHAEAELDIAEADDSDPETGADALGQLLANHRAEISHLQTTHAASVEDFQKKHAADSANVQNLMNLHRESEEARRSLESTLEQKMSEFAMERERFNSDANAIALFLHKVWVALNLPWPPKTSSLVDMGRLALAALERHRDERNAIASLKSDCERLRGELDSAIKKANELEAQLARANGLDQQLARTNGLDQQRRVNWRQPEVNWQQQPGVNWQQQPRVNWQQQPGVNWQPPPGIHWHQQPYAPHDAARRMGEYHSRSTRSRPDAPPSTSASGMNRLGMGPGPLRPITPRRHAGTGPANAR
jgi:predicted  nucleic acid-binding Zn-ribbon protein